MLRAGLFIFEDQLSGGLCIRFSAIAKYQKFAAISHRIASSISIII
jgi:hypothetical protein